MRLLVVIGLGTFGFGMADVLLEPYGGQVLAMSVAQTTKLTAVMAAGGLVGFALASRVLGRGANPLGIAAWGALVGVPAFAAIIWSAHLETDGVFIAATLAVGFGAGLFGHGTLTATMRAAPKEQVGLALGAWGAVQATAAGLGIALGGVMRDVILGLDRWAGAGPEAPYVPVFAVEMLFLTLALVAICPLLRQGLRTPSQDALEARSA